MPAPARPGRIQRKNHPSAEAARGELVKHGYHPGCPAPDAPAQPWMKSGAPTLAIGREDRPRSSVWHIVDYPRSTPAEPVQADLLA